MPGAYPQYAPHPGASSNAQWAIGLAIASWLFCGLFTSVPAFFMARSEMQAIDQGTSPPAGRGLAQAAFWIAVANMALTALVIVGYIVFFAAFAASLPR